MLRSETARRLRFLDTTIPLATAIGTGDLLWNSAGTLTGVTPGAAAASCLLWNGTAWIISSAALAIGTSPTEAKGLVLRNTTAAAAGAQQYSPSLFFAGQGWETTGGSSDEAIWRQQVVPIQGAAMTAEMQFDVSLNGGAFANKMRISSAGHIYASSQLIAGASLTATTYVGMGSGFLGYANAPYATGLSAGTDQIYSNTARSLVMQKESAGLDAANAICLGAVYNRNAASITNAATVRVHSVGWTNNSDVYAELASVLADGTMFGGAIKSVVAEAAAGTLVQHSGTGSAGTASAIPTITAGLKTIVQVETLSPSAVETSMGTDVPAGSVIRAVIANCQTALTGGGTTVTWSVGTAGDPDKYGSAGYPTQGDSLAQNGKSNWVGAEQVTSAETVVLTGAVTGGAGDGDTALTNGSVKIMVIYDTYDAMPNA